jgi:hypothetical protein
MVARYNPYAMDPALSAGISNLTKALIGSAKDDAAVSTSNANNALANYRNQQAKFEDLKADYLKRNMTNQDLALGNNPLVNALFNTLGLPQQEVVQGQKSMVAQNPGMAKDMGVDVGQRADVPFNKTVPINYDAEAMKGLVGSILFGGVPGNPEQTSKMGMNIQNMANTKLARDLLLANNTPTATARSLLGLNLGQYDEPGSAMKFAQMKEETARLGDELDSATDIKVELIKQDGLTSRQKTQLLQEKYINNQNISHQEKIKKMENALEKELEMYRIETTAETERLIESNKLKQKTANDKDKLKLEKELEELKERNRLEIEKNKIAFKKWEKNNETLTTTFDQVHIVSEEYARAKNIPKQTEGRYKGMYILDGGFDPSKRLVKLSEGQVAYMSQETADYYGVKTQDNDGNFVAKGNEKPDSDDKKLTSLKAFTEQFKKDYDAFGDGDLPLPPGKVGALRNYLKEKVDSGVIPVRGNDGVLRSEPVSTEKAYEHYVMRVITAGNVRIKKLGITNFNFPKFFFDVIRATGRSEQNTSMMNRLGYNSKQQEAVYKKAGSE